MEPRVQVLKDAIGLTTRDRNETYGDFTTNLQCLSELKEVYRRYAGSKYCLEHDTAIELALHKLARIATGTFHRDNYVDLPNYTSAAYEAEIKLGRMPEPPKTSGGKTFLITDITTGTQTKGATA